MRAGTGYWILDAGWRRLDSGYWMAGLDTGWRRLDAGCGGRVDIPQQAGADGGDWILDTGWWTLDVGALGRHQGRPAEAVRTGLPDYVIQASRGHG